MKYKLNVKRDVDVDGYGDEVSYILNLPYGFRFADEIVHVKGYDSMQELRNDIKQSVITCDCKDCLAHAND
jgi:23S rRNA G2445 N2-methylase RlmL